MKKCLWILDLIYRTGGISFQNILRQWDKYMAEDYGKLSNSTFRSYIRQLEDMFDLIIDCTANDGYKYKVSFEGDLNRNSSQKRLLSSFSVNNLLTKSSKLSERVLYEDIPSKDRFLVAIMEAMRDDHSIELTYKAFTGEKTSVRKVEPYCVKIFRNRWYLLAKEGGKLRHFALDRMLTVSPLEEKFEMDPDFSPNVFYDGRFGVIVNDELDREILEVKAYGKWVDYLLTLPLHESQQVLEQGEDYAIFRYDLFPSDDFFADLLSKGDGVEILSPSWCRDDMRERLDDALRRYQDFRRATAYFRERI